MKQALVSLLLIVISLLIVSAFSWNYVYQKGLHRPDIRQSIAFFSDKPILIAYRGASQKFPENTLPAFDAAIQLDAKIVLWADVRLSKEGQPIVFADQNVRRLTGKNAWCNFLSLQELRTLDPAANFIDDKGNSPFRGKGLQIPTLAEFLARYPQQKIVLNFLENANGLVEKIAEMIKNNEDGQRVLIASPIDGFSRDLRVLKPNWFYAASAPQVTRFELMSSIGLARSATLRADVYLTEVGFENAVKAFPTPTGLEELNRRHIPWLIGPINDSKKASEWIAKGAKGVISAEPENFTL